MFDIDFFKQVNDNYGHAGGCSFAQLLQREISSNIVGRVGGEEFLQFFILLMKPKNFVLN